MKNIMEDIVDDRLEVLLGGMNCCKCEQCVADMKALALNTIKPKYANSSSGELFSRVDALHLQNSIDIDIAVSKAINLVAAMPNHKKKK